MKEIIDKLDFLNVETSALKNITSHIERKYLQKM
jgi:hypothetical protein